MRTAHLSVKHITKSFSGIRALKDVSVEFAKGEVHTLLGENGAGKSTLCKIISGALQADGGEIVVNGQSFTKFTPQTAKENGVSMIYQEFNLVPEMTVHENVFLGKELRKGLLPDRISMIRKTKELFDSMGVQVNPEEKISALSVAQCQLVEIAKALMESASLFILDEPTAALTMQETESFFKLVKDLKAKGSTIIFISHRLDEVFELSDRITIMRDGEYITTVNVEDTSRHELIRLMVGRELEEEFPEKDASTIRDEIALKVKHLQTPVVKDVSFELRYGEVLALAGLVGAGRTETLRAIFGADKKSGGEVYINGELAENQKPIDGINSGIAFVTEDRKREGLQLLMSIKENITLIRIKDLSKFLMISAKKEKQLLEKYVDALSIKMGSADDLVSSLSGGNQQKVVISKWMATNSKILFLDEPTRGIDVGAKAEIYELIQKFKRDGSAVLLVTSEMAEVIGLADRVLVMYEGRITGELTGESITQERILALASDIAPENSNMEVRKS